MKNPFEIIARNNQVYKKYVITTVVILTFALVPFALRGFTSTNADFVGFLPKNIESDRASELIAQEFPGQSSASMVILLESTNSTLDVFDPRISALLEELELELESSSELPASNVTSWVSLENQTQDLYQTGMEDLTDVLISTLIPLLDTYKENISLIKNMFNNFSSLAKSVEVFSQMLDYYLLTYYDFARSIFYLSNLTDAYSSYFFASDYSNLYSFWDNTTGSLNQIMTLQAYLASFDVINPAITPDLIMDSFVNNLVFNFFNQSIAQLIPQEQIFVVYQFMNLMNTTWNEAFLNETIARGSLYGSLLAPPTPTQFVLQSQQYLLGRLINISKATLSDLFGTILADQQLQQGLASLQDSLDFSRNLIPAINTSLIESLHDAPMEFMGLWFDFSRAIFYLSNFTTAYQTNITIADLITINDTWAGTLFGLENQDTTLTSLAYSLTNMTYQPPSTRLGTIMATNPSLGDSILNNLVFSLFNGSAFQEWAFFNPTNLSGYFQTSTYQFLLLLNETWTNSWSSSFLANGALFSGYIGQPWNSTVNPGNVIEYSQLGVLNRLMDIANTTFKEYVTEILKSYDYSSSGLAISAKLVSSSSSSAINEIIGLTIQNDSELESFVLSLALGILSQYPLEIPLNMTLFSEALTTQIIPIAIQYRNSSIPDQFMEDIVVNLFTVMLEEGSIDLMALFDPEMFGSTDLGSIELNTTALIETINITELIINLYLTTIPDSMVTTSVIAFGISSTIVSSIMAFIPEPTIHSLPRYVTKSLISADNSTTLLIISFSEEQEGESLTKSVEPVRVLLRSMVSEANLDSEVNVWVTGGLAQLHDSSHSINEDIESVDLVAIILVLILLSVVFISIITPVIPLLAIGIAIVEAIGFVYIIVTLFNQEIPTLMLALLTVTMLGAGVDYCLFILWRYKEERQNGRNRYIAIREATIHAGESVVSSGSTVMIGFGSLLLSSFPLMTQLGLGPMVGIAFSLLAAMTIIPIILHLFGDKVFFPRNFNKEFENRRMELQNSVKDTKDNKSKNQSKNKISFLNRMSRWTVRNPWPVILAFVLVTAFFSVKASEIEVSYDTADLFPLNVESMQGFQAMEGNFPKGQLYPIKVVLHFSQPLATQNDLFYDLGTLSLIDSYADSIQNHFAKTENGETLVSQINTISRPNGVSLNLSAPLDALTVGLMQQFVGSASNTTIVLDIIMDVDPIGVESLNFIGDLRKWNNDFQETNPDMFGTDDVEIIVGGTTASFKDMSDIMDRETPIIILFVLVGIFIVLYLITGSIFTPIRLELTILMTVIITLGASQLVFVEAWGYGISWIMPIMLFVLIFGLGMDYDIFIITRMREEVALRGLTDEEAIIEALDKTSTIITAAGLIMASSLGSLFVSFFIGILLDATLVRQLLVPAIMVVAKKANWWNPIKALQRVPSDEERKTIRDEHLKKIEAEYLEKDLTDSELKKYRKKLTETYGDLKTLQQSLGKVSKEDVFTNLS
ncbi:MAG: MMPL family transporter, partial [Candidatus Hodarchaeales archaeon]